MPTPVTVGGVTYQVPLYNENGWAQGQGNLSQLLIALAAVSGSTPALILVTTVTAPTQDVATGNTYLVNTSSIAITLNLPDPTVNSWFIVKDKMGTSASNNITLHRFGTELIEGVAADATLAAPYGCWGFFTDGTDWFQMFNA